MKKWCIGFVLITAVLFFGSCKSSKKCNGSWYGNRNLGYVPEMNKDTETSQDKKLATTCEVVEP